MPTSTTDAARTPRKPTRSEKAEANRQALLRAAAELVGEVGYEATSIARITERAGLAQGTFYRHFESRQAMFDMLLPNMGEDLLASLRDRVHGASDILDVEEKGFRGFFEFVERHPGFYRILNEAEIAAPKAFDYHIQNLAKHYVGALKRSHQRSQLPGFEERELEVIAYILMAARFYIYLRFAKSDAGVGAIPDWVVRAYMKFVAGGLNFGKDAAD